MEWIDGTSKSHFYFLKQATEVAHEGVILLRRSSYSVILSNEVCSRLDRWDSSAAEE